MNENDSCTKSKRRFRLINLARRFRKDRDGATAIEFAFVAGPFFLLVFAIIETSVFFFASQYLETTIDDVTRKVRTGQLQHINSAADFKDEVCKEIVALFDCHGRMKVKVQTAATFDALTAPPAPVDDGSGGYTFGPDEYTKPGPVEITQVTASYLWPIYTNYSAPLTASGIGGYAVLHASAVIRTEPF